jgi:oxygen-dependent protoporphyrinogen oxidase
VTPPVYAVVGGGISGLAAARRLAAGCPSAGRQDRGPGGSAHEGPGGPDDGPVVELYEASPRLGGKVRSLELAGRVVELGPDAFVTRNPAAARLARELGLGDALVAPAVFSASVYARGTLRPLPAGLALGVPTDLRALRRSGIVSRRGLWRAALDLVLPGVALPAGAVGLGEGPETPSAGTVFRRRLGDEVVDLLVDPLLGGINAGRADDLSLSVAAPGLAVALAGRRSALRALAPLASRPSPPPQPAPAPADPPFLGLDGGLERLVERLREELETTGVRVVTSSPVDAILRDEHGLLLDVGGDRRRVAGVVLATPAYESARLLEGVAPGAAELLAAVPYASVAVATLVYAASSFSRPLTGSGVLVPRSLGLLMTACTFLSLKWPSPAEGRGRVSLRVSAGRAGDERAESLSDRELLARLREELALVLGVVNPPLAVHLQRWPRSFPQYRPGHLALVARAASELAGLKVALAGAALGGIGLSACVASGEGAAESLLGGAARTAPAVPG